jgi:hypothetical protein
MDYEERMTAAFAALDLQEARNYSQVAKKYKLERTTLAKRYKGQTVSRKVFFIRISTVLNRSAGRGFD